MVRPLYFNGRPLDLQQVIVGRVCSHEHAEGEVLVDRQGDGVSPGAATRFAVVLTSKLYDEANYRGHPAVAGIPNLNCLNDGDIVAVHPSGRIDNLFRSGSLDNALFVTDQCNSNCLMCSQPPKAVDDLDFHYNINAQLIPLIPINTEVLGMTGGEPTLLGWRLIRLLRLMGDHLPHTELQMLTNGRAFTIEPIARKLSDALGGPAILCVPVYSDHSAQHDYIVQARGAFAQTITGLHNLARNSIRTEIRVVLHAQTIKRLPQIARFIHKNLPFVDHVALMGLEYTGYTPFNNDVLWIDPPDYQVELSEAVGYLDAFHLPVSIYNLPLCLLDKSLWPFAKSSISDWKRDYQEECAKCMVQSQCGGVFGTSKKQSVRIKAVGI